MRVFIFKYLSKYNIHTEKCTVKAYGLLNVNTLNTKMSTPIKKQKTILQKPPKSPSGHSHGF